MGCGCRKKSRQEPQVIVPTPVPTPQTPEQQHAQEMNEWNGGNIIIEETKEEN